MLTNKETIKRFLSREAGRSKNLSTDGTSLYSYGIMIATFYGRMAVPIYPVRSSVTTMKHCSMSWRMIAERWLVFTLAGGVDDE